MFEIELEAGAVVVSVVVTSEVGLIGGAAEAVDEVVVAGQFADPQSRSVGQQPPPSEAGHER